VFPKRQAARREAGNMSERAEAARVSEASSRPTGTPNTTSYPAPGYPFGKKAYVQ